MTTSTLSAEKNKIPISSRSMQLGILVLHRGQPGGLQCQVNGRGTSWFPSAMATSAPEITLSKSSLVSSVRGSWENMQSSPLMQFPVVWYNLHGKSRSWQIKVNASSHGTHPRAESHPVLEMRKAQTDGVTCSGLHKADPR